MSTTTTEPVIIPLADDAHLDGCPKNPARTEHYEATRPAKDQQPARVVTVVRCGDCGEQVVHEGSIARVFRKLNENGGPDGRRERNKASKPVTDGGQDE
jgi:predicted metal-binding protein